MAHMKRSLTLFIPLCILGLGVFLKVANPPFLAAMQLKVFDTYQTYQPRPYQEAPVTIVDIDEESLKKVGQWPWPRTVMAQIIDQLTALGASVVVMDVGAAASVTSTKSMAAPGSSQRARRWVSSALRCQVRWVTRPK